MKKLEFRQLIREEIRKVINEDRYDTIKSTLKYDDKKVKPYKVGSGNREGMPVSVDKLKQVIGKPLASIEAIEDTGVNFTKAFVHIRGQFKSYLGTGSGTTMAYSFFGKDSEGNEIIYDKYEGGTAGGGQAFLFINGKKTKASDYITDAALNKHADIFEQVYNILKKIEPKLTLKQVSEQYIKNGIISFRLWLPGIGDNLYNEQEATKVYTGMISAGKKIAPLLRPILDEDGLKVSLIPDRKIFSSKLTGYNVVFDSAGGYGSEDKVRGQKDTILIPGK